MSILKELAPVAQRIEHLPSKQGIGVRFLSGAHGGLGVAVNTAVCGTAERGSNPLGHPSAPVAQWIERRPPKAKIGVQFLSGALS